MTWTPGERAVIDRQRIVTIDRVTPSGRAVVGHQTFGADGRERTSNYRPGLLELLTAEIEVEMGLRARALKADEAMYVALDRVRGWQRNILGGIRPNPASIADIQKAEALAAAIRSVMGDGT